MGRYWRRHPKKDLEALIGEFHEAGWRIIDPPLYYKVYCPCPLKHKTTIHLTPSSRDYAQHKLQWLYHHTCYIDRKGD